MTDSQKKLADRISNPLNLRMFSLRKLPMGLIAGLRIREINDNRCQVSVPFKYLNKNPFKSIYFAVQSMAAEMSTAVPCMIAVQGRKPSVAWIIVDLKANFPKKATGRVFYTCEDVNKAFEAVDNCIASDEPEVVTLKTVGKLADGTVVGHFEFTWSFKRRKS